MKTVEYKVGDTKVHLRLTAGGQIKLKEKFDEDTLTVILGAVTDISYMVELLSVSLNYKNNDNAITDGEELYDLLVDDGKSGASDFAHLATDIAVASGIITKQQANSLIKSIVNTYESVFEDLENSIKKENDAK